MQILVIKLSSLGDLFHALPAVHALKQGLNAEVDWATHTYYVEVVKCFTDVRRVIGFARRGGLADGLRFLHELRRERYDLILDLQGLLKSAVVARAARGARRIGPSFHREGSRLFYNTVAGMRDKQRHAVEEVLDVVRHLNLPVPSVPDFPVVFPKLQAISPQGGSGVDAASGRILASDQRSLLRSETSLAPHPRIALAPCSRWPTKNWPAARFSEVARALHERTGATFFLVGAPEDKAVCDAIAAALGSAAVNLCGQTSLVELGSVLAEMDLALTVDTGPMHVAAALGVPVLALFGPTDPRRTGPFGAQHRVLQVTEQVCAMCFDARCHSGDLICMTRIRPDVVTRAALDMLEAKK
ncbi:MAG: glycosyltransferase family 9 protein [Verrucomicrobia bacterium]|nr:MAG: glycosyltransferase family 9 protein [Verrucomicrobiota bacterium]